MSDLDSSLLLSSSGCSSREAVLLQHPPLDQVADQDDVDDGDDDAEEEEEEDDRDEDGDGDQLACLADRRPKS